jgi:hypothetical protein
MSVSSFFFWVAQVIRPAKNEIEIDDLESGLALSYGIFIEKVDFDGKISFLCANSQIGFFYKDRIYKSDLLDRFATNDDVDSVFEYLANKIDECEELARKLNEIQRGLQNKQTF